MRKEIRSRGGRFYKWVSPGEGGVPDRIVVVPPEGRIVFVEMKTPVGELSELQKEQTRRLRACGCDVRHIYGWEQAKAMIEELFPRQCMGGDAAND